MLSTPVIVEDDPQLQRLLRKTLSPYGFRQFEALTAAEGLREAEKDRPDIVLLDLGSLGGELTVDLVGRRVLVARQEIPLTRVEYRLLEVLVKNACRVVPRRQLLTEVWGPSHAREGRYLRVYMTHLQRKLEADPGRPKYLLTEPTIGYRLVVE